MRNGLIGDYKILTNAQLLRHRTFDMMLGVLLATVFWLSLIWAGWFA